ncbi:unnamed protein product [Orchesella dallaii]|uniref:Insulin-like domain-containing protein n=1 Tax=Orchesella dallaii TaxID=48710 RepID=A0ABP1PMN3_9HEXA
MANLFEKPRFCYFVLVVMTLSLHIAFCTPRDRRGARIQEHELQRGGSQSPSSSENRRLCRDRLKHELQTVCGFDFYNPDQHLSRKAVQTQVFQESSTPHIRKNRAAKSQHRRRMRRRYTRSSIIQECCEKPCNPVTLLKYCSSRIRNSTPLVEPNQSTSQSTSPSKVKTWRLSRNPNILTLQDQPNCLGHPDCNTIPNEKQYVPKPSSSSSQCVSIADLENFYFKLFQKKWNKDATQTDTSNIINSGYAGSMLKQENTNDYSIATNQMFPNNLPNPILKYDIDYWQPLMSSTTEEITTTEEDGNKIEKSTEPQANMGWPPNVVTMKPYRTVIFSKGTYDY